MRFKTNIGLVALLAALYMASGWFGLKLAVPPGYATAIWPASGIAVAGLLLYGSRLWPGIFLGSFAVNSYIGHAFDATGLHFASLLIAGSIAMGSTLQALFATTVLRKLYGTPVSLNRVADVALFALVAGPVSCLIASSVGVTTLIVAGALSVHAAPGNWLTWWLGDLIGIVVFLPIALFGPWRPWSVRWSGHPLAGLTMASLIALLIPLGLTFYAWKWTSNVTFERNRTAFAALVDDNETALRHRLDAYLQALDGAAGLVEASDRVTVKEWRTYVTTLDIARTLPGINGIGFINAVDPNQLDSFLRSAKADGVENLAVHPAGPSPALFVIRYLEPIEQNAPAIGLNLASEQNRYEAALHARDSGRPTITRRIVLVQDATKSPGFLLLRPLYRSGMPSATVEQRRAAFLGWVYAPFIATRIMQNLTAGWGRNLEIEVFDGRASERNQFFYSNSDENEADRNAAYSIVRTLPIMEQEWTLRWKSTPAFEGTVNTSEAWLVLLGGLLLSMLFGVFLLSFARREESIRQTVEVKTREIVAREEETRSIVDTAVVAILLFDENGDVISANRAVQNIFGYDPDDLAGVSINQLLDFAPGQSPGEFLFRLSGQGADQPGHKEVVRAQRKDGSDLYLDLQINTWTTEKGASRYTVIARDISLQRRMTLELEQAEQRWHMALRGANIGVFDVDLKSGTSIVSDTWRLMLGFEPDEDINPQNEWMARVHPEDLPMVQTADEACFEGRAQHSKSEYRIRRKDGVWRWLRSEAAVTERDENGVAMRLVGTQTDITDLKEAQAELEASKKRLRSAIENAPIGMALLDLDGRWLKVNDALCKFLGYTQAELLKLDFQTITHPEDLEVDLELVGKLLSREIETYQLEKRYVHKDGHALWGLLSVSIAKDSDGSLAYFISQVQDISHRKEMDRLKNEFISTVSHELRTPLTSIRGSLGLVTGAMAAGIPEGVMRLLSIANKNSERLILLINDILDLEKLSADSVHFEFRKMALCEEVQQAVDANRGYADQFGVSFKVQAPEAPLLVDIDAARFQQVLSNLLSNAVKFSPHGGQVLVEVGHDEKNVRVAVSDKGSGVPSDFRSRIFTPFSQADGSAKRTKPGTGLGLHISKQMIERMGGTIDYTSVEGVGSTFWVELPLVLPEFADLLPDGLVTNSRYDARAGETRSR